MAHRSQSSSVGDNSLDPNYLPPHYREEYRLAIDALIEDDLHGYYEFLKGSDVVDFLARTEIEHIKSTIHAPSQTAGVPELTYHDGAPEADGLSSDTYWPMNSDLDAPGLDLGWPLQQHSFVGPTEVTTLVNPSDPDMPSIKEQARRLIKNAHHVIAVVMDMFTDVDIFADLLDAAARHVPVYILLDEQNSHHFVTMVTNCRVNLELVHMMRVRTVAGITYFCRTGKSFKGQVKDRFLLADCRAVLSGNYSFMWSYEKIHRCIAHLFLGELVASFDEEFRILFAQSHPLVIDKSVIPLANSETSSTSSYLSSQFGIKRTQSLRNPRSFLRQPELPSAIPYGDAERNSVLPFRRNDTLRQSMESGPGITIGKYSQQQFHLQQSFFDQGRSIVSRQMELSSSAFNRHSYAEGTQESYSSSRQYMKHRVMNNLDETAYHKEQSQGLRFYNEGPGPGSGHGHYDRLRGQPTHLAIDQYSNSSFPSDHQFDPPLVGNYGQEYLSSDDLKGPEGHQAPLAAGIYGGGSSHKRPTIGQAYACQSSPTQPHPPEKQAPLTQSDQEQDQDSSARQGMRSWRINSYLSTYEDSGEEGLTQPMGPDAFEDPQPPNQPGAAEVSAPRFGTKEQSSVLYKPRPDILRPRFGKPVVPEHPDKPFAPATTRDLASSSTDYKPTVLERSREWERSGTREAGADVEMKDAPDITLSKHESFRTRINPLLQRSSRLRSSLIFASSKGEKHSGDLGLRPATEEDDETTSFRSTSIVAQILEKRRSLSREPFNWRKRADEMQNELDKSKETPLKEESQEEPQKDVKPPPAEATAQVTIESLKPQQKSSMNMNDPASRLQYFKDLAATRKVSTIGTDSSIKDNEPAEKKPDFSDKPPPRTSHVTPSVSVTQPEPELKKSEKPDISAKIAELARRSSVSKPPVINNLTSKLSETSPVQKEESTFEIPKKEPLKSLKPLASPKFFKRDPLKLKALNPRRISCGEEIVSTDATDSEKSELKKSRSHSSSTMTRAESKDILKNIGSCTSINTLGGEGKIEGKSEGKSEGKPLDFLKKQTQRLKGFLGPKDHKDKKSATSGDEKSMNTVMEVTEEPKITISPSKDTCSTTQEQTAANHKTATGTSGASRYQTSSGSVLFSSNLRDDTKVILEQISANSHKNRLESREDAGADKNSDGGEKVLDRQNSIRRNRFLRPQPNTQEREGLLKRIESMRKEKKVYSRFEMGNSLG